MEREYEKILHKHLNKSSQMIFLAGPRQVGKTTIAKHILETENGIYLNWDILKDRELILKGPEKIMEKHDAPQLGKLPPITVLDEIHKFKDWKNYLKGFYDQFGKSTRIIVTGSSRIHRVHHYPLLSVNIFKYRLLSKIVKFFPWQILTI